MVKILFLLLITTLSLLAEPQLLDQHHEYNQTSELHTFNTQEIIELTLKQRIEEKIQTLLGEDQYLKNENFIHILFEDSDEFIIQDRLDVVKIVDTLKENGLLKLFFDKPQNLNLTFTSNGNSLYFIKLMSESLRSMGYYRYITKNSKIDESGFHWQISLKTEYVTDPILLRDALRKQHCEILDINRSSEDDWHYIIDMSQAHLDLKSIKNKQNMTLNRAHNAHWIDVSKTKKLTIHSLGKNNWFPNIAFYDKTMHLVKVYKRDKKTWKVTFNLPKGCTYVKIDDLYSMKNIREGLSLYAKGVR